MYGEYRAAALNLANSSDRPLWVSHASAPWLLEGVYHVPWTDTAAGRPVGAALWTLPRANKRTGILARPCFG